MLVQIMYLRRQIYVFIHQNSDFRLKSFQLSQNEIQYINYFIYILKSFKNWTLIIFQKNKININEIWLTYNFFFNEMKEFVQILISNAKTDFIINKLINVIEKMSQKLMIYYKKTTKKREWIYNFICILNSYVKLNAYNKSK